MIIDTEYENPLIWPLLSILQSAEDSYKVHYLASELGAQGLLPDLDNDPNKALFKRNFLLMNALYQLQTLLLPKQWLQIQSLDIQLMTHIPAELSLILAQDAGLRNYYLDWSQFDTSAEDVEALFASFWNQYDQYIGKSQNQIDKVQALHILSLPVDASYQMIQRQWRKLALKWHPDRPNGDAAKFCELCAAWKILRQ